MQAQISGISCAILQNTKLYCVSIQAGKWQVNHRCWKEGDKNQNDQQLQLTENRKHKKGNTSIEIFVLALKQVC